MSNKPKAIAIDLNWDSARLWEEKVNEKKDTHEPKWSWDCSFKLDFDGPLLAISSRFYPPNYNNGDWWEGVFNVVFLGETILTKEFKEDTLEQLHDSVEKYLKYYAQSIKARIKT